MSARPIPREKIPWFPSVETEKCTGCRICLEYCSYGVYAWDETKKTVRVERPYACITGCSGCKGLCPAGAISFPDLEEIAALIRRLRVETGAGR